MANINNKVPIQFRCRPIRSNSCTTQPKLLPKPPQLLTLPLQIPTNTLTNATITTPPHIQKSINLSKPIVIDKNKPLFSQAGQKTKLKLEFHIPKKVGLVCDAGKQLVEEGEGKEVGNNKQRRDDAGDGKYQNGRGQKYKKKISLHSLHSDETLKQAQSQTNFKQKNKEQLHLIDIKKPSKKQKKERQRKRKTQLLNFQQYSSTSQHGQYEHENEDINFSNTSSIEDKNQNQNERDLKDYESKATMKNQINLRIRANVNKSKHQVQQKEIKYMLMELADGHHQMMAMLKHIMKRDGTAREEGMMSRVERENIYNQNEVRSKSVYRRSRPSNSHYQRSGLKINRVYDQMIISNTDPSFQSNIFFNPDRLHPMTQSHAPSHTSHTSTHTPSHLSPSLPPPQMRQSTSTIRTNKLPSQIATILAQVIKQNVNYNPIITLQMQLRQLISRRFQIFYLNYNYFLELLINLDAEEIQWGKFKRILMEIPFLLDQGQVEVIRRSVVGGYGYGKDGKDKDGMPLNSINTSTLPVPLLAQKLRYFIYDRQPFDRNLHRLKIHQLKSILTSKSTQYQQKCLRHIQPQSIQTLSLQQLQKVFKQLRLEDLEIEIIIGKLCIESNNINQLKYRLVVDRKWLEMLAG